MSKSFFSNSLTRFVALVAMTFFSISPLFAESLEQGAYVKGKEMFVKGYNSIEKIEIQNAPSDTDYRRYAMLHDGTTYRLYFFKRSSSNTLYQFGFNPQTNQYEYGYKSIPVLSIVGKPSGASTKSFAMLHDGSTYRLYLQDEKDPTVLHQFAFNPKKNRYEYGLNSIPTIKVKGIPDRASFKRWGMLHDGSVYRLYVGKRASKTLYQAGFNPSTNSYEYGYKSIPEMKLKDFFGATLNDFALLHDGKDYRLYIMRR